MARTSALRLGALAGVLALVLGGCGHSAVSPIDAGGFSQRSFGILAPAAGAQFIGPDWRIDDWVPGKSGWEPKKGEAYQAVREIDLDGDGQISDDEHLRERVTDLKLSNQHDGSVIWIKAHTILPKTARLSLSEILDQYGEGLAAAKPIEQVTLFSSAPPSTHIYTQFLVERDLASVNGYPAVAGVFEQADSARLAVDPKHRVIKSRVIIAKIGHLQRFKARKPQSFPWPATPAAGSRLTWIVQREALLVLGYAARAENYEDHVKEFESFVDTIRFAPFVYIPEDPESVAESVKPISSEPEEKAAPAPPPTPPAEQPEAPTAEQPEAPTAEQPEAPAAEQPDAGLAAPAPAPPPQQ